MSGQLRAYYSAHDMRRGPSLLLSPHIRYFTFTYIELHLPLHCLVISGIHYSWPSSSLPRITQDHQHTFSPHCPPLFQTVSEVLKIALSTLMPLLTQGSTLHKNMFPFMGLQQGSKPCTRQDSHRDQSTYKGTLCRAPQWALTSFSR